MLLTDDLKSMVTLHRSAWQRLALLSAVIFNPLIGFGDSSGNRAGVSSPALSPSSDSLPHAIAVKEGRDIPFRRLPRSASLSQTRVAAVAQDRVGFMWFGTQYGLNRFDGYKSKVFKHELRRADSLSCVYKFGPYCSTMLAGFGSVATGIWIATSRPLKHSFIILLI